VADWIDDDKVFDRIDATLGRVELFLLGAIFGVVLSFVAVVMFGG
jgi:hypothetical protein